MKLTKREFEFFTELEKFLKDRNVSLEPDDYYIRADFCDESGKLLKTIPIGFIGYELHISHSTSDFDILKTAR